MYPRGELKDLARLRKGRIRTLDRRRRENCDSIRRVDGPLRLLDWTICEWRATRQPASLAMVPVEYFLHRSDQSSLESVHRILRGALVVFAIARELDRLDDGQPERLTAK